MVGMKEICALLLAGGIGAGSVVTVQQVEPATSTPKKKASAPKAHKTQSRNVTQATVMDCPTLAAPLGGDIADLAPLPSFETLAPGSGPAQVASLPGGGPGIPGLIPGGGGGGGGSIDPLGPPSGVPQPASWAMMVTGFGLVGFAMRKGPEAAQAATDHA